jgi:hypothetical protein
VILVPFSEKYTNPFKNLPFGYNCFEHTIEDRTQPVLVGWVGITFGAG